MLLSAALLPTGVLGRCSNTSRVLIPVNWQLGHASRSCPGLLKHAWMRLGNVKL
jgi:hypothetical protein